MLEDSCESRRVAGGRALMTIPHLVFFFLCVIIHFDVKVQGTWSRGWGLFYEHLAQSRIFDPAQKATYSKIHWYPPTHPSIKSKSADLGGICKKVVITTGIQPTSKYSSRMRTTRFLGTGEGRCMVPGGGMVPGWRVWCRGSPSLWTDWQTRVKTLPSRNFVCGR